MRSNGLKYNTSLYANYGYIYFKEEEEEEEEEEEVVVVVVAEEES